MARTRSRRLLAATVALAALGSVLAAGPAGAKKPGTGGGGTTTVGTPNGTFSCRAALARLEGAGLLDGVDAELFTANAAQDPCQTDFAGILAKLNVSANLYDRHLLTTPLLRADLKVLYGGTQLLEDFKVSPALARKATAEAGVARLDIAVLGNRIEVAVLTSNAKAKCSTSATPYLDGHSQVVGLRVNGLVVELVPGHEHVSLYATVQASLEVKALFKGLVLDADLDVLLREALTLHLNHQSVSTGPGYGVLTQRALWLESRLLGNVIVAESIADYHGNPCTTTTGPPPPPPPPSPAKGWMTGGGRITPAAGAVTHGFRLECTPSNGPNNLQVNWGPGQSFHLESVISASCSDNRKLDPGNPTAGFDTLVGSATGRCNNGGSATATYTLTDDGEPGSGDLLKISISGDCNLAQSTGHLDRGNHQAHGRF
ncbi:MAG TPA: hypothetical protein VM242_14675 [Acidimicrobiales bacterium]|nr:hypothetical protein [Acidimicrobiales bacterium]